MEYYIQLHTNKSDKFLIVKFMNVCSEKFTLCLTPKKNVKNNHKLVKKSVFLPRYKVEKNV